MACSAYDPALLDGTNTGTTASNGAAPGPGGTGGGASAPGSSAGTADAGRPDAEAPGGATGAPDASGHGGNGIQGSDDSDGDVPVPACGDGEVADDERCDTAIAREQPGACPTECPAADACSPMALEGAGCQTRCVSAPLACTDGDGCCPAGCSNPQDDDCSASCGDGVVQPDAGESCEIAGPDGGPPAADACPTECPDDGDACTVEMLTGSADNCNAACAVSFVEALDDGDGCCPDGANSTLDDDCPVMCGNDVVEPGEECDGGSNCDDQCRSTVVTEQQRCLNVFTEATADCHDCMCASCTAAVNDCFDSGNARRDADCAEVVYCGLDAGCRGSQCYCGLDVEPDDTCLVGDGPCAALLERVAGSSSALAVYNQQFDPNTAIGRARAFTLCHGMSCLDACR